MVATEVDWLIEVYINYNNIIIAYGFVITPSSW